MNPVLINLFVKWDPLLKIKETFLLHKKYASTAKIDFIIE